MRIERAGERGSILLHVMVTGVLIAVITASFMRMTMLRYQMVSRSTNILQEKRNNQGALASVLASWNPTNSVCGSVPAGYTCGAMTAGTCNCTCTQGSGSTLQTVSAQNVGGVCVLTITSPDLP